VHCILQISLQARGLAITRTQSVAVDDIISVSNVTAKFAILYSEDVVFLCDPSPDQASLPQPCQKIPLTLSGLPDMLPDAGLNGVCTQLLAWPQQMCLFSHSTAVSQLISYPRINQAMRECVAMIIFQAWLFGVSVVGILNESIPHVSVYSLSSITIKLTS
jgi:hypothetical protein